MYCLHKRVGSRWQGEGWKGEKKKRKGQEKRGLTSKPCCMKVVAKEVMKTSFVLSPQLPLRHPVSTQNFTCPFKKSIIQSNLVYLFLVLGTENIKSRHHEGHVVLEISGESPHSAAYSFCCL